MPRRPIEEGCTVIHMDGKRGRVMKLVPADTPGTLPRAIVRWSTPIGAAHDELLPVGYLERAYSETE